MDDGNFDLFGLPVRVGHGRKGRPPFVVTDEDRNRVKLLLACGWDDERIANAVGITKPTLRKHFFSELKVRIMARDAMEAQRLEVIHGEAIKGNVAANKLLDKKLERYDAKRAADEFEKSDRSNATGDTGKTKARKLGKKEEQLLKAGQAVVDGGLWADDLDPSKMN